MVNCFQRSSNGTFVNVSKSGTVSGLDEPSFDNTNDICPCRLDSVGRCAFCIAAKALAGENGVR